MNKLFIFFILAVTFGNGVWAQGNKLALEAGASTLGLFAAPSYSLNDNVKIRAPFFFGNTSRNTDFEGNNIKGKISFNSAHLLLDYHLSSAFRASGGVSIGGYKVVGDSVDPTLDGKKFTGTFQTKIVQKNNVVPVVSLSFVPLFSKNIGLSFEVGVRFTSMTASSNAADILNNKEDLDEYNESLNDFNAKLSDRKFIPFVSLGIQYRF